MAYLLDTQALIWAFENDARLSDKARKVIANEENTVWVSIASLWEMAIKISIGKLDLAFSLEQVIEKLEEEGIALLPIQPAHILQVRDLPMLHRDPFDRIIIAQACAEKIAAISSDDIFGSYPIEVVW